MEVMHVVLLVRPKSKKNEREDVENDWIFNGYEERDRVRECYFGKISLLYL